MVEYSRQVVAFLNLMGHSLLTLLGWVATRGSLLLEGTVDGGGAEEGMAKAGATEGGEGG